MPHPPDEPDLAALREEIRRAGRGTRALRWTTVGCFSVPLLLFGLFVTAVVYSGTHLAPPDPPEPTFANLLHTVAEPIGVGVIVGMLVAVPAALLYRLVRRRQLRRTLASLPPQARAEVLLPLRREPLGDTRKIVEPLIRAFGLPTEVTPAP